jgi:FMN phosphatase YigB (HAD superfamily)
MSSQIPKAVIFDLGKVVLDFDYGIAARTLAPFSRTDATALRTLIDQSPLLHQFETGLISSQELFESVTRETGFHGGFEAFHNAFGNIFEEIEPMVNLHREIRAAGIPTHVLSNTNEIAIHHIRQRFPFFHSFDSYIFSHEVGAMKPTPAIYEALEQSAGLTGPDLLYIDDRAENIDAALARGWQSILHHDPAVTVPEVWRRLGRA